MTPLLLLLPFVVTSVHCLQLSVIMRKEMVDLHNRVRRSVFPRAASMNFMVWSDAHVDQAKRALSACASPQTCTETVTKVGLATCVYTTSADINMETAMATWLSEKRHYTHSNDTCAAGEVCNSYRQIIFPTVSEIGCANRTFPWDSTNHLDWSAIVCVYDSKVLNSTGKPIYTEGEPGSGCSGDGFNTSFSGSVDGLCVYKTNNEDTVKTANSNKENVCRLKCTDSCKTINTKTCTCECPKGHTTEKCDFPKAPTCSGCVKLGTSCEQKSEENKAITDKCYCKCPATHIGPQCQVPKEAYENGIFLQLKKVSTEKLPIDPTTFEDAIRERLDEGIRDAVNTYCKRENNSKTCCGNDTVSDKTKDFLDYGVSISFFGDHLTADETLGVAVYISLNKTNNEMCEQAADRTPVPRSVLLESVKAGYTTINKKLTVSNVALEGDAKNYAEVASTKYKNEPQKLADNIDKAAGSLRNGLSALHLLAILTALLVRF